MRCPFQRRLSMGNVYSLPKKQWWWMPVISTGCKFHQPSRPQTSRRQSTSNWKGLSFNPCVWNSLSIRWTIPRTYPHSGVKFNLWTRRVCRRARLLNSPLINSIGMPLVLSQGRDFSQSRIWALKASFGQMAPSRLSSRHWSGPISRQTTFKQQ